MELSHTLLRDFAAITNDEKAAPGKEKTIYGTIVEQSGAVYVQLDGSDILTPAITVVEAKNGDRVTVIIKDHTAIVTGNLSAPAITRVGDTYTRMTEAGVVVGRFDEDDVPEDAYTLVAPDGFYVMASSTRTAAYFGSSIKLYKPGTNQAVVDITSSGAKFVGRVETTAGTIGGWDITTDGIMYTSSNFRVGMLPGTNSSGTYLFVRDDRGSTSTYPFVVRSDGSVVMSTGHIGLGTKKIEIGADATDAYLYYGMTSLSDTTHDGFFVGTTGIALGKGAFKVTAAGYATITGKITATSGSIGDWSIADNGITYTSSNFRVGMLPGTNSSGTFLFVRDDTGSASTYPFVVRSDGSVTMTKATVTGQITATSGSISDWSIADNGITYTSTGQYKVGMLPGTNSSGTYLYVRDDTGSESTYPFVVRSDGSVTMTKATITGVITAKNSNDNKQTVIDSSGINVKNSDGESVFSVKYFVAENKDWAGVTIGPTAIARARNCLAVGDNAIASGWNSCALGPNTMAGHFASMAFGSESRASGSNSVAIGLGADAESPGQIALGKYNVADANDNYLLIVGNGSSSARSNAFTIDWSGNGTFSGVVRQKTAKNVTLTRISNSYVDATSFARMSARLLGNLIVVNGNLNLTAPFPKPSDPVIIGYITYSGVISQDAMTMVTSSNGQPVLIDINTNGEITIYNYGSTAATGWIRFCLVVAVSY